MWAGQGVHGIAPSERTGWGFKQAFSASLRSKHSSGGLNKISQRLLLCSPTLENREFFPHLPNPESPGAPGWAVPVLGQALSNQGLFSLSKTHQCSRENPGFKNNASLKLPKPRALLPGQMADSEQPCLIWGAPLTHYKQLLRIKSSMPFAGQDFPQGNGRIRSFIFLLHRNSPACKDTFPT